MYFGMYYKYVEYTYISTTVKLFALLNQYIMIIQVARSKRLWGEKWTYCCDCKYTMELTVHVVN